MFDSIKRLFLRKPAGQRMFAAARPGRLVDGWTRLTTSADAESLTSLTALRNRARSLIRDNPHAKRAQAIIVNNVIGTGIGLQANITNNRGRLAEEINEPIEDAWAEWCCAESCHVGGSLHFCDLERLLLAEWFAAGEVLVRIHRTGRGAVPLSLEVIEADRLADEWEAPTYNGNLVRQGVEVDEFHRPIAYWLHQYHPGDPRRPMVADRLVRIPAEEIIHLRQIDRWPQVRGVPPMHAAMAKLYQLGEFQEAAVVAARLGAEKVMVLRETEDGRLAEALGEDKNDGTFTWTSGKGQVDILPSGTEIADWNPEYPNTNFDPFVRSALRDIAAAFGVSYESLSRDYSQSNYSSSRLALLDDRDGWRVLQRWYIRTVRDRLHKVWLESAILAGAIPAISVAAYVSRPRHFEAVTWKPRGWSWVDPTKEVNAYKEAVRCGFATVSQVIAQTGDGRDFEDVANERRRELDALADLAIPATTNPDDYDDSGKEQPPEPVEESPTTPAPEAPDAEDASRARVVTFGKRDYE
ncbi:MAG TPA: phage portal protein [Rhodocyclaceae bacterium]|uniref:phage portal protein n=1 Tax=Zoogloea sp. TaxID=49181 RepID=UPI002CBCD962|nr:phage portal protein [Zoogloea sp.]HMV62711.1 phage portal protein [Rhodocyclaceae bacterium]HMY98114.1 phage portal protein [Burkholderiaceae bacterium]HNH16412.1 phage portal protein [Zoogloea sp.]